MAAYYSEKAGNYEFREDRYLGPEIGLVKASPEKPATLFLPSGSKIDDGLRLLEDGEEAQPVNLAPHHAGFGIRGLTGAQHFSAPKETK